MQPFKNDIPDEELEDLHTRVARTRYPDVLDGAGWVYGMDLETPASLR